MSSLKVLGILWASKFPPSQQLSGTQHPRCCVRLVTLDAASYLWCAYDPVFTSSTKGALFPDVGWCTSC